MKNTKLGVLTYIIKDNKTLMLYRNKKDNDTHEGLWLAPGGKVEYNESPQHAAVRETYEETGLKISNLKLSGLLFFSDDGTSPFESVWYVYIYRTDTFSGDLISSPEGTLKWIDNDEILNLPMWEGDKIFTPYIYKDKLFSAEFDYRKYEMVKYDIKLI